MIWLPLWRCPARNRNLAKKVERRNNKQNIKSKTVAPSDETRHDPTQDSNIEVWTSYSADLPPSVAVPSSKHKSCKHRVGKTKNKNIKIKNSSTVIRNATRPNVEEKERRKRERKTMPLGKNKKRKRQRKTSSDAWTLLTTIRSSSPWNI